MSYNYCNPSDMLGATLIEINHLKEGSDDVYFTAQDGRAWRMHHVQDCCEHVTVEQVDGEVSDLLGSPLLMSEEVSGEGPATGDESYTWTFYKFATVKGYVTVRWYGSSNGYYSESVTFERTK